MSSRYRLSLSERIEIIKWHANYQNAAARPENLEALKDAILVEM